MATLNQPTPVIRVERKELELSVQVETDQHVDIGEGDRYVLKIGDDDRAGDENAVVVKRANYMTHGVTRRWTLTLVYR